VVASGTDIASLGNWAKLRQTSYDDGEGLMITLTTPDHVGEVALPNGSILAAEAWYDCGQGDADDSALTQQQLLDTSEYRTALDILSSIRIDKGVGSHF
jgi:hypothetical protein